MVLSHVFCVYTSTIYKNRSGGKGTKKQTKMKKIFYTIFMSALIATAATSCNKDDDSDNSDIFSDSGTTTPSGYVSEIKFTDESTNSEGVKEYETSLITLTYDSKQRLKTWVYSETELLDNGGSKVCTETVTYYYEDNKITACSQEEEVTTEYSIVEGVLEYDVSTDRGYCVYIAELDDNGVLLSASETWSYVDSDGDSDNGITSYAYNILGDKIISYIESRDDVELYGVGLIAWEGDNTTLIGSDVFEYSTIPNNQNIDLNMAVTNSEEQWTFFDGYFGILTEIKGFHSTNMISSCEEEGRRYDILYVTDSNGRVTQAKWDKSGAGNYNIIDVTYYQ